MQIPAACWDGEAVNSWNWSSEWTKRFCFWIRWDLGLLSSHR